jgi:hypothetical protein
VFKRIENEHFNLQKSPDGFADDADAAHQLSYLQELLEEEGKLSCFYKCWWDTDEFQ